MHTRPRLSNENTRSAYFAKVDCNHPELGMPNLARNRSVCMPVKSIVRRVMPKQRNFPREQSPAMKHGLPRTGALARTRACPQNQCIAKPSRDRSRTPKQDFIRLYRYRFQDLTSSWKSAMYRRKASSESVGNSSALEWRLESHETSPLSYRGGDPNSFRLGDEPTRGPSRGGERRRVRGGEKAARRRSCRKRMLCKRNI